jgi:hypothetical protein
MIPFVLALTFNICTYNFYIKNSSMKVKTLLCLMYKLWSIHMATELLTSVNFSDCDAQWA